MVFALLTSCRSRARSAPVFVAVQLMLTAPMLGQEAGVTLTGKVASVEDQSAIANLVVEITALGLRTRSDDEGVFRLSGVPPGFHVMTMQRIGYRRLARTVQVGVSEGEFDLGTITLEPVPTQLDAVVVEVEGDRSVRLEIAGFYRRRDDGLGSFADPEDFEKWRPRELTDILRHMEGFRVVRNPNYGKPLPPPRTEFGYVVGESPGRDTRQYIIRSSRVGSRGQCPPLLFLDGLPLGSTLNMDVNLLNPDEISGIEAYSGLSQLPAQFNLAGAHCGVIVVWSR